MNVVDLVRDAGPYIGKDVTVTGVLDRPRKKHSNYLFFNVEQDGSGIQAVVKKDILGAVNFKKLISGLCHKDVVTVAGQFNLRNSSRDEFYKYEIIVTTITKS